jgi:hypothetical protein
MHHCALQHSAWHGICMEQMRLLGMNLAGVGVDVGASSVILKFLSIPRPSLKNTIDPTLA